MRDTDKDWALIASTQPYFGVLSADRFRLENLDESGRAEFFASGEQTIARTIEIFEAAFGPFQPRVALDFGCGVGRLLLAMTARVEQAYGVDIAPEMRRLAAVNLATRNVQNATILGELPDVPLDWVNSHLVLQHIPPARGYELIARLWERLRPGGLLSLQVTLYHDRQAILSSTADMAAAFCDGAVMRVFGEVEQPDPGRMMMYDYDLNRLIALFDQRDGDLMVLSHTNHGGCRGASIHVRKN